jgi:hypothetical protein
MSVIRGAAWVIILNALAIYPLLNTAPGHSYPRAPTFGLTPCPLVVFTFGILGLRATGRLGFCSQRRSSGRSSVAPPLSC